MKKFYFLLLFAFTLACPLDCVNSEKIPAYRVVLDPGHGGIFLKNKKLHGDRYDELSGKYLSYFADGAHYRGNHEHIIVYDIARKAEKILSLCSPRGDFKKFSKILNRYSKGPHKRIIIETIMSRNESVAKSDIPKLKDPNGPYRLYDYRDSNGKRWKGRISRINAFKPHLVLSIHTAKSAPPDYIGMNAVIAPPYGALEQGLRSLQKGRTKINHGGWFKSWFRGRRGLAYRRAFYEDVSLYFTGFDLKRNYTTNWKSFRGYKHNMVSWSYGDEKNWAAKAKSHPKNSVYADYSSIKLEGKYWQREKGKFEQYRRGRDFKDFGGDNYYASKEILRYILTSLAKRKAWKKNKVIGKPFVSVWSVPLLVNAISAYVELGYFDRRWDRTILKKRQNEIAEGIAVGIYSLLAGLDKVKSPRPIKPSGRPLNLKKYAVDGGKTYFDMVTH